MKKYFVFLFLLGCINVFGFYPNLDNNPRLTPEQKERIEPYLIPLDHPIKPTLDFICSKIRVSDSVENIKAAGFQILAAMPQSFTFVSKHPLAPGYVFKIHLDSEKKGRYGKDSWQWLIDRCFHARKIKKIIEKNNFQYFTVPDKWLYPLPVFPAPTGENPQPVILVATEMKLASDVDSRAAWKALSSKKALAELFEILKSGSGSPHLFSNVPYTQEGKFAFVDTERKNSRRSRKLLDRYLSKEMNKYWLSLF